MMNKVVLLNKRANDELENIIRDYVKRLDVLEARLDTFNDGWMWMTDKLDSILDESMWIILITKFGIASLTVIIIAFILIWRSTRDNDIEI